MNKKIVVAMLSLLVLLIASLLYNVIQHQKNHSYEKLITLNLNKALSDHTLALLANEEIFNAYASERNIKLLQEDASNLCYNFKAISTTYEELDAIAQLIYDNQLNNLSTITAKTAEGIHYFLARNVMGNGLLGDCTAPEQSLLLNDIQLEKFKRIQHINSDWVAIITKQFPPKAATETISLPDRSELIKEHVLFALLEQLSRYAIDTHMTGINQFFNHE